MKEKSKKKFKLSFKKSALISAVIVTVIAILVSHFTYNPIDFIKSGGKSTGKARQNDHISGYANANGIPLWQYPDILVNLLEQNSETEDFILNYPFYKDKDFEIDLSEYKDCKSVPLFMQWDKRWGYKKYGSGMIGMTGCGPTCLSMVAVYLLKDTDMNPLWMSKFSTKNGYCKIGDGTLWTLISEGSEKLGLNVEEIPLDEERIIKHLNEGKPVICVMGPGNFTNNGHYIVLTGYTDGGFTVNDPNSVKNSEKYGTIRILKASFVTFGQCLFVNKSDPFTYSIYKNKNHTVSKFVFAVWFLISILLFGVFYKNFRFIL